KLIQASNDFDRTSATRVRERAAAERSEARTKNDRSVDEVRISCHAFAQDCDAFVYEHQNHAVDEIRRYGCTRGGRLHGFAVFPLVEPGATLAAELFLREQRVQLSQIRRRSSELGCDDLADMARHIEPDDVRELDRSHRH